MITKDDLLQGLRINLLEHGQDISVNEYERKHLSPGRSAFRGNFPGMSWPAIKALAMGSIALPEPEKPPEAVDIPAHFGELSRQNASLLRECDKLRNRNQLFIETCLPAIARCSFRPSPIPKPERVKRDQGFHSMQGDFHIGEKVDPDWVQGVSECNMDILLKERLPRLCERIITFREQDKAALGLNKLVIHLLGDIVTGELIFKGQAYHIDATLVEQLMQGSEAYINALLTLAAHFPSIELYCVQGNHGRHGMKGDASQRSNFDFLFYKIIQRAMSKQENVSVYVSDSPTMLVQHGEFVFGLNHGENVVGYSGIPYYGLDRKARRLDGLYGMQIHYKLSGHFHMPAELNDETLLNGTMVGGSDLSVNRMMLATRPSQKIFYLDDKHGIHRTTNLFLADRVKLTPDDLGIFTAYTS